MTRWKLYGLHYSLFIWLYLPKLTFWESLKDFKTSGVDADYRYIFIDVGNNGHDSDGGTFQKSSLYKALHLNLLEFPNPSKLQSSLTTLPYFFISDGAYSLSDNFMKPYPKQNLTESKKTFNYRLSRARVVVENGFGYTSQVFGIYYTTIDKPPNVVNLIVLSTCVLHNMLIDRGQRKVSVAPVICNDSIEALLSLSIDENDEESFTGKKVRDNLLEYFLKNPINLR